MTSRLSNALVVGAVVTAAAACGGCALSAAAVPSAMGAAPVVAQNQGEGQGNSFWVARYDDVVQAALRAAEKLSLEVEEQDIGEDSARLRFRGGRNVVITLHIEFWTDTVTRMRVDVGSSRFAGFGTLLGQQIIDELNDADAFLVDWSDNKDSKSE